MKNWRFIIRYMHTKFEFFAFIGSRYNYFDISLIKVFNVRWRHCIYCINAEFYYYDFFFYTLKELLKKTAYIHRRKGRSVISISWWISMYWIRCLTVDRCCTETLARRIVSDWGGLNSCWRMLSTYAKKVYN